jgi:hypothetical protein
MIVVHVSYSRSVRRRIRWLHEYRSGTVTVTRTKPGAKQRPIGPHDYTVAQIAYHLNDNLGPKLTAFMVGKDQQTVARWARGTQQPPRNDVDVERRLRAAFAVYQLLSENDTRHVIRAWFLGMNPQLDDVSPAEAIANGDLRDVMAAARAFVAGG